MSSNVLSKEIPAKISQGLTSEKFSEREDSERQLLNWAETNGQEAIRSLSAVSKQTENPEIALRVADVLRALSDLDYLSTGGRGFIGIRMDEVELPGKGDEPNYFGILVTKVLDSSPASRDGLEVGDIITKLDGGGWKVDKAVEDIALRIGEMPPLAEIRLTVLRGEREFDVEVVLGKSPVQNLNMLPDDIAALDQKRRDEHFRAWREEHGLDVGP